MVRIIKFRLWIILDHAGSLNFRGHHKLTFQLKKFRISSFSRRAVAQFGISNFGFESLQKPFRISIDYGS